MNETLKTIVTVIGLTGGVLALVEKCWKGVAWVVCHRMDRSWAAAVHSYLAAPQDEAPAGPKPKDVDFFYRGGHDDPERLGTVSAKRERAVELGRKLGLFLMEKDGEGRVVVRLAVTGPPSDESRLNTLRRVYDDLAQKGQGK